MSNHPLHSITILESDTYNVLQSADFFTIQKTSDTLIMPLEDAEEAKEDQNVITQYLVSPEQDEVGIEAIESHLTLVNNLEILNDSDMTPLLDTAPMEISTGVKV